MSYIRKALCGVESLLGYLVRAGTFPPFLLLKASPTLLFFQLTGTGSMKGFGVHLVVVRRRVVLSVLSPDMLKLVLIPRESVGKDRAANNGPASVEAETPEIEAVEKPSPQPPRR